MLVPVLNLLYLFIPPVIYPRVTLLCLEQKLYVAHLESQPAENLNIPPHRSLSPRSVSTDAESHVLYQVRGKG